MTKAIEVWVCVDAEGNYTTGSDADAAADSYVDAIGSNMGRRLIKLTLTVPLPLPIEASGTVPDDGGNVELTVG